MEQDYNAIGTALTNMLNDLKSGDPTKVFMALMVALYQIFPAIEAYKGDNIKQLADSENVASDIRSFVTGAETAFNDTSGNGATNLYYYVHDLNEAPVSITINGQTTNYNNWLALLSDQPSSGPQIWGGNPALDPTDESYVVQSFSDINTEFGQGVWGNTGSMATEIKNWYTISNQNPEAPASQIKSIQNDTQQANQSVSTLATSTQSNEQFYTQEFNQIIGIDNDLLQGQAQQNTNIVQNQKSN
jgi:hypothetical protein